MPTKPKSDSKNDPTKAAPNVRHPKTTRPKAQQRKPRSASSQPAKGKPASRSEARTKTQQLLALLASPDGTPAGELGAALGWQAHTVRAALSGLRKAGHAIDLVKFADGQGAHYRLGAAPAAASAAS